MDVRAIIFEIDAEIAKLTKVKEALQGTPVKRGPGSPQTLATASPVAKKRAKRKMSAEGKARISAAQKARWAKLKTKK
jgi:hypothetical protein